jgi:hypothetical protein
MVRSGAIGDREHDLGERGPERAVEQAAKGVGDEHRIVAEHAGAPCAEDVPATAAVTASVMAMIS